jgi:hypothetical protein
VLAAAVVAAAVVAVVAPAGTPSACLQLEARRVEVCTAYVANATLAARVPFYKFARDTPARSRAARFRLESRYVGKARTYVENQVRSWPPGRPDVDVPRIEILSLSLSADESSATLVTRETWHVETGAGRVLFAEARRRHVVSMHRLEGVVLHKWVVTSIA